AAADAHGAEAETPARAAQLVDELDRDDGAGCGDRVTERDRATVRIDALRRQSQLARNGAYLGGEGFVRFDDVQVSDGKSRPLEGNTDRRHGSDAHAARLHSGEAVGDDAGERRNAPSLRLPGVHEDDRRGPVVDAGRIA